MNKLEFLGGLRKGMQGLPTAEVEERLMFFDDMIEDRMEEGLSEEAAVAEIGTVDEIIAQIVAEIPLAKIAKESFRLKRKLTIAEIVLIVLGSPIWLSLAIAAVAVIVSLYISLWAVIISLWAVFVSLIVCAVDACAAGIMFAYQGNALNTVAMLGVGLVCVGLSVFAFYGCKATTKGAVKLAGKCALLIKNCFIKRGEAK